MKHKTSQALFAYWNGVRAGRTAPQRFEIEPSSISAILPYTFILERLDAETYRYRLAGTCICDVFGGELRGTNFLDGWTAIDRLPLLRQFSMLSRQGTASVAQIEVAATSENWIECEVLLLPLRHTRDTIDRVLGSFAPMQTPSWIGAEPVSRKRVISNDVVWPGTEPAATISPKPAEEPIATWARSARIVRSERRQFRVFEGGRGRIDVEES